MQLVSFALDPRDPLVSRTRDAGPEDVPLDRHALRLGALLEYGEGGQAVVDLARALAVKLGREDAGAPEAEAESRIPADPRRFLEHGAPALASAREALAFATAAVSDYEGPDLRSAGIVVPRSSVRLSSPVPQPGKLIGVARNYADHARERGAASLPEEPVLFLKASSCVVGPRDDIVVPHAVTQPDYEGELAVVVGSRATAVGPREATAAIAGYCVANDVSARDYQNVRGQHFIGKSCDTFAPLGPALVTSDEIADPQDLGIRTRVSGEIRQEGRTKDMLFSVAEIVAFASHLFTLEPGDVILTGTPSGVGAASDPPRWLRDGDVVEIEIEGVGRLVNHVRFERGAS
ncbi:MAG: fumarylacetoacetate hydrolase family protein [Myxococcota bacterium]